MSDNHICYESCNMKQKESSLTRFKHGVRADIYREQTAFLVCGTVIGVEFWYSQTIISEARIYCQKNVKVYVLNNLFFFVYSTRA